MMGPKEDAFVQLPAVARELHASLDRRLAEYGVFAGQHVLLGCLWERDGLTPGQLAHRLGVETPTITRAVARMSARGLVEKRGDDDDHRLVRIWLTARGRGLRRTVPRALAEVRAEFFAPLSQREMGALGYLLARLTPERDADRAG